MMFRVTNYEMIYVMGDTESDLVSQKYMETHRASILSSNCFLASAENDSHYADVYDSIL